jgi:hypothetical protein
MKAMDFESVSGNFTITPHVTSDGTLTHVEVLTSTGTVIITSKDLKDFSVTVNEVVDTFGRFLD